MGLKTVQLNRAYLVDKDDDIYLMYEHYLSLVQTISNPNLDKKDASIAASNLVVAKLLQKVINIVKE